jgi:hypothetical protein
MSLNITLIQGLIQRRNDFEKTHPSDFYFLPFLDFAKRKNYIIQI